jgi:uncharacterized protein
MIILLSPAKSLTFDTKLPSSLSFEAPKYIENAQQLIDILRLKSPADIATLMKLSDKLAALNYNRYQQWTPEHDNEHTFPCAYLFDGDVYKGLDVGSLQTDQVATLSKHVRHLSGLYGILKPLESIYPYRLEMGTKLDNPAGTNLYHFWKPLLADSINTALDEMPQEEQVVVNCASTEYFKAVDKKQLKYPVISPEFKDFKNGQYKIISFFAKRARGLMARHLVQSGCTIKNLLDFAVDGYQYNETLSTPEKPIFTRKQAD